MLAVVLVLAALGLAVGLAQRARRSHHARVRRALQRRFGAEYDRAVEETGSGEAARRELRARARRVAGFSLRELREDERARFRATAAEHAAWFVDDPTQALQLREALVREVMRAQGYPASVFEQELADLSVQHADVVDDQRRAHEVLRRSGRATPEQLADAMWRYGRVLAALLEPTHGEPLRGRVPLRGAR